MKKAITATAAFLVLSITFAQQKTVEEIYADYINAIGGKEKLANVVNRKKHSILYSSTDPKSVSILNLLTKDKKDNKKSTTKTPDSSTSLYLLDENITFIDITNKQYASIKRSPDGNFARTLNLKGFFYVVNDDGSKKEYSSSYDPFKNGFFPETIIHTGSVVLPNEVYKGEEVYVVKYEVGKISPATKKNDVYEYFSANTGLRVAAKQIMEIETGTYKSSIVTIMEYGDYKEVDGILIPHKTIFYDEEGKKKTEHIILNLQFNIDPEDFKLNCFQQPEAYFEQYSKE